MSSPETVKPGMCGSFSPSAIWRNAAVVMGLTLLALLALFWDTFTAMTEIWRRSETFAHGFVVPVIAAWLIWRDRTRLLTVSPRPAWWALLLLAGAGLAWLLGVSAEVNSLSQFALVAMLVLIVPCVAGLRATKALLFPLGFLLIFLVPMGEFLLPQLMEWTADFTVTALRFTSVPVYREGQQLVIPSGHWSVVEACSGIRYLIASLMVGTLYAYLNYYSLGRRIVFVVISGLVPLVANWLRAYMVVMIGHLSSNRLATGVDHILYGWVFFGIVMALMFWVGSFWHEPVPAEQAPVEQAPAERAKERVVSVTPAMFWIAALAVVLVSAVPRFASWAVDQREKVSNQAKIAPIGDIPGWHAESASLTNWRPRFSGASDEVYRIYRREGREIGLYLAFYRHQNFGRKLITSTNVLAEVAGAEWSAVASGKEKVTIRGEELGVLTTELRGFTESDRLLAWHWYWIGGRVTSNVYLAKAYTAVHRLLGQGDDSAVIIVYAPRDLSGSDKKALSAYLSDAEPLLMETLRQTRNVR